ncbi:MAG: FimB/Mfa2 family fimbrial subunit [Candidatus Cryptobacteroides sp.]
MKATIQYITAVLMTMIAISGCIKRTIFNTPHPNDGALKVEAFYAHKSEEAVLPEEFAIIIDSCGYFLDTTYFADEDLLEPGFHSIYMFNIPEGMELSDSTISVCRDDEGNIMALPGYFYSGRDVFEIRKDDTLSLALPLIQHTRRLDFLFKVKGGSLDKIESATCELNGLYRSIDLEDGSCCGEPSFSRNSFVIQKDTLKTTYHLLGLHPDVSKTFRITIHFIDGHDQSFETVLDSYLKDFNETVDKKVLTGNFEAHTGAEFGFTIEDWKPTDDYEIDGRP